MAELTPPRPLRREDDRESFDCGRPSINHWFRRYAWRNQESGASRTSIVSDPPSGAIVGLVSLSMAEIVRDHLPRSAQRNQPDPLPAILLGQLAVDLRFQGRGLSRSLLVYALTTAVRVSREVGCFAVLTHPLDDGVRAFYGKFGFEDLPFDPGRAMALRITDLERASFSRA
jgi:predicted N-acetyltransferase YhbS